MCRFIYVVFPCPFIHFLISHDPLHSPANYQCATIAPHLLSFRLTRRHVETFPLFKRINTVINPLTPNDHYSGCTAPLTSKHCILYIYSTNIGIEYFKRGMYCPFFSPLQIAVCFIILTYLVPVLFTFSIQSVLKFKKIIPVKRLILCLLDRTSS